MTDDSKAVVDEHCPISMRPFSDMRLDEICYLPCAHRFERASILKHFRTTLTDMDRDARDLRCPVCRLVVEQTFLAVVDPAGDMIDRTNLDDDELREELTAEWIQGSDASEDEEDISTSDDSVGSLADFIDDDDAAEDEVDASLDDPDGEFMPDDADNGE